MNKCAGLSVYVNKHDVSQNVAFGTQASFHHTHFLQTMKSLRRVLMLKQCMHGSLLLCRLCFFNEPTELTVHSSNQSFQDLGLEEHIFMSAEVV